MEGSFKRDDTPEVIYRYRSFDNEAHLNTIERGGFWFAHADSFNDPFDLSWGFDYSGNRGLKIRWAKDFLRRDRPDLNEQERNKLASEKIKMLENNPKERRRRENNIVEITKNKFGICAMSAVRDDILMWSHYASNHSGFCVGLNKSKLYEIARNRARYQRDVLDLYQVEYNKNIPQINFYESMLSNRPDIAIPFIKTKSKHWSYEKEYRLVLWGKTSTPYPIGIEAVDEIILGCKILPKNKSRVISIVKGKSHPIRLIQAEKHPERFELSLKEIIDA